MAEEENTEENTEETGAPKKSNNIVLIVIAVVLVLVLAIVGLVVVMLAGDDSQQGSQNPQSMQSGTQKPIKLMESMDVGPMFPLDTFTVNLLSDSGRRYLKVQMNLELDDDDLAPELETKTAVVRDVVIRLLSSKTLEEISTSKGKLKLKEQMVNQINLRLRDGYLKNIYFTEFVVQ